MKRTLLMVGFLAMAGMLGPAQAAGDAAAGKAKADPCAGCHGDNGEGTNSGPKLAGMPVAQFTKAIQDFKSGERRNTAMKKNSAKLTDEDIANLAAYYASLKAK